VWWRRGATNASFTTRHTKQAYDASLQCKLTIQAEDAGLGLHQLSASRTQVIAWLRYGMASRTRGESGGRLESGLGGALLVKVLVTHRVQLVIVDVLLLDQPLHHHVHQGAVV